MRSPPIAFCTRRDGMHYKSLLAAAGFAGALASIGWLGTPVAAQGAREAEMVGFHQLCERGDRKACVRFGMMLGENRARHGEWRRQHADWWWWER
jgi:hypothetical protein